MWTRWFPWRWVVSRLARSRGFVDPMTVLSRLHRFAQPSEVTEPIELLRAGVIFHARGLINARAIQHNLDWVWPHWVERQFDPHDVAFVPRAFSITHVNLTHRNWTAVGLPDCDWLPIVDPRGLITPTFDGWSIDAWVLLEDGRRLLPSRSDLSEQRLRLESGVAVDTQTTGDGCELESVVDVGVGGGKPTCVGQFRALADAPGFLAISLRPANPEGVSFIHQLRSSDAGRTILVNDEHVLTFDRSPQRLCMSCYHQGDVLQDLTERSAKTEMTCDVGLATAAALFPLNAAEPAEVRVCVPRPKPKAGESCDAGATRVTAWPEALSSYCRLSVPDSWMQFLYDAAVRSLILHSPGEVYPGPYTYKRFWFRDAAFILDAMLALGFVDRVRRCIDLFPKRQTVRGYFLSQEGEWDSNGAAMWIMHRFARVTGETPSERWLRAVKSGAAWITHKRLSDTLDKPHAGLLPAGFSAEHLGPNDFYFWDDFWSVAGLRGAAELLEEQGDTAAAASARSVADQLMRSIDDAIESRRAGRSHKGVPASPYRRMDAGAIGSIAVGYPLQLWDRREPRLLETVEFLIDYCTVHGGFFQDMIHSGINAYLTLEMAQVLIRADEGERAFELIRSVANLASPTGQWPEAIHPHTRGGCMGDGQHIWAAAEWVLAMRNLFARPEGSTLVIGQGIPSRWLRTGETLSLGPAPTVFGTVSVEILTEPEHVVVKWDGVWRRPPAIVDVRLPGLASIQAIAENRGSIRVARSGSVSLTMEAMR